MSGSERHRPVIVLRRRLIRNSGFERLLQVESRVVGRDGLDGAIWDQGAVEQPKHRRRCRKHPGPNCGLDWRLEWGKGSEILLGFAGRRRLHKRQCGRLNRQRVCFDNSDSVRGKLVEWAVAGERDETISPFLWQ